MFLFLFYVAVVVGALPVYDVCSACLPVCFFYLGLCISKLPVYFLPNGGCNFQMYSMFLPVTLKELKTYKNNLKSFFILDH